MMRIESRLQSFSLTDLASLVREAFSAPTLDVLDWQCRRLMGGSAEVEAGGLGVYRIFGTGRDAGGTRHWSLILKVVSGSAETGSADLMATNFWKREVLAYQSGALRQLPSSLSAPQCYAITEYPGDEFWLWLEDIHEPEGAWTLDHYALAARHLGQFNGAYLTSHPLPVYAWLTWGRVRPWLTDAQPIVAQAHQLAATSVAPRWLGGSTLPRLLGLWEQRQTLLEAFEHLPVCLCHHDAFRRNLFACVADSGEPVTIAIDWSYMGYGRLGEDAGMSTANNLVWLEVPAQQARELDHVVFSSYVEGLRDAGWHGDQRLVRLGYVVNAGLTIGVALQLMILRESLQTPDFASSLEQMLGHPCDAIFEAWSIVGPFLLDLGEEAIALTRELA